MDNSRMNKFFKNNKEECRELLESEDLFIDTQQPEGQIVDYDIENDIDLSKKRKLLTDSFAANSKKIRNGKSELSSGNKIVIGENLKKVMKKINFNFLFKYFVN